MSVVSLVSSTLTLVRNEGALRDVKERPPPSLSLSPHTHACIGKGYGRSEGEAPEHNRGVTTSEPPPPSPCTHMHAYIGKCCGRSEGEAAERNRGTGSGAGSSPKRDLVSFTLNFTQLY